MPHPVNRAAALDIVGLGEAMVLFQPAGGAPLESVTSYSFLAGSLALTYRHAGAFATLLFTPRANLSADWAMNE